jgi:hypothetical protein
MHRHRKDFAAEDGDLYNERYEAQQWDNAIKTTVVSAIADRADHDRIGGGCPDRLVATRVGE